MANSKLEESKSNLKNAENLISINYKIIKENKILLKALQEIGKAIKLLIEIIEENKQKESPSSQINKDSIEILYNENKNCGLSEKQLIEIKNLFEVIKLHKQSPMEFSRKEKWVIMSEEFQTNIINLEMIEKNIATTKDMLKSIEERISKDNLRTI